MLALGAILKSASDILATGNIPTAASAFKAPTEKNAQEMQRLMGQWIDRKIVASDIQRLVGDRCVSARKTMEELFVAAKNSGITKEEIQSLTKLIGEKMSTGRK